MSSQKGRIYPPSTLLTARLALGYTQLEVAQAVGCSRPAISLMERGLEIPSVYTALLLAKVLQVPVTELFPLKGGEQS